MDSSIPQSLSNIVMSLLAKNPHMRPNNALMVADSIEKSLQAQKWEPQFFDDMPKAGKYAGLTTEILPDTVVRNMRLANNE
jgi:hypothetical protein